MFETISRVEVARDMKGSEKGSCGYTVGERVSRGNVGLMLNGIGDPTSVQAEDGIFFALFFICKAFFQGLQVPGPSTTHLKEQGPSLCMADEEQVGAGQVREQPHTIGETGCKHWGSWSVVL